jgi:molybdopterin biosynthesis enzyme
MRPALRCAETATIGIANGIPVIETPARLDVCLATRYAIVQPYLDAITGRTARPVWRRAPLTRKIASGLGSAELVLLRETDGGLEPLATGSLPLSALALAEGFALIPPDSEGYQAGETIEAHALRKG